MALVLSIDAKLYYCVDGVGGTPTWSEITNCKDVTLSIEDETADVTVRGGSGWKLTAATLHGATIEFQMVWDTDDDAFSAIKSAWLGRSAIGIACMSGDITLDGSEGLVADMAVTNFTRNEALNEALTVDVSLTPTYSADAPDWLVVGET